MDSLFFFIVTPFLFSIYPILFLFANNLGRYSLDLLVTPIEGAVCFTLLFLLLLRLLLGNIKKAALLVSFFYLLFFSYGHFYTLLNKNNFILWHIGTNNFLFFIWVAPILGIIYFVIRSHRNFDNLIKILNIIAALLVCFSLFRIGAFFYAGEKNIFIKDLDKEHEKYLTQANPVDLEKADKLPDIYYIIFDSYSREDIIKKFMDYDNSELIDYLKQKGFYIAGKSMSNYEFTDVSLSSSLNLNYLQHLLGEKNKNAYSKLALLQLIRNSYVVKFLRQYGYKFVAFDSGVSETQMYNADIYMAPRWSTNDFTNLLLESTLFTVIKKRYNPLTYFVRRGYLYSLDHIQETAKMDGPLFVFAHNNILHPPFLLGKEGEALNPESLAMKAIMRYDPVLYRNTLVFLNKKIKKMVDDILSHSRKKPIIILQADHGAFVGENANIVSKERMSIFNAYYLPNGGDKLLYQEISPVNTFRVIFNHYFGTNFDLLKDKSYHSPWTHYFNFVKISKD